MAITVTRENEMSTSQPPQQGEPNRPPEPEQRRRTFSVGALAGVAAAVLVVAGVGGYLIGHSSGDDAGTKSGKQAGYQEGLEKGRAEVTAEYQRGQPGYNQIFDAGRAQGFDEGMSRGTAQGERTGEAQGQRTGFEQGQRVGVSTGQSDGVRQGAAAVLGGFDTWADGAFYIVTVGASQTAGVPYTITSRSQMQAGTNYKLCDGGGGSQICQTAVTAATPGEDAGGAGTPTE